MTKQRYSLRVAVSARAHMYMHSHVCTHTCARAHTHETGRRGSLGHSHIHSESQTPSWEPGPGSLAGPPPLPAREWPAALTGWRRSNDRSTWLLPTCHMVSLQSENGPMATVYSPHLGRQMDQRRGSGDGPPGSGEAGSREFISYREQGVGLSHTPGPVHAALPIPHAHVTCPAQRLRWQRLR